MTDNKAQAAHALLQMAEKRGVRLTAPRKAVIKSIAGLDNPFSAGRLLEAVASSGCGVGRATVFRTLQMLCEVNVLERIRLENGQEAYVTGHPDTNHHHLICTSCGRMENLLGREICRLAEELAAREGYAPHNHIFEIYGICPACQDKDQEIGNP
ncbi:MAG TPA: transcriptional repressor [Firmicutes bacterium]|nr:transcriptional repressor [Bacillota bacterium]